MQLHLYISDPEDYYNGDYDFCWHVAARTDLISADKWIYVGELDLDLSHISSELIAKKGVEQLDAEIERERAYFDHKITNLEARKQKLLALEGPINA